MEREVLAAPGSAPQLQAAIVDEIYSFSSDVVMISDPTGPRTEALRALRTNIVAQHVDDGRRGLAICAASAGVGASFIAVNLAVALAQIGVKTLLIDGDLRRPAIDRFIVPPSGVRSLSQYLEHNGDHDIGVDIQVDVLENLSVIYAGGSAPNAQELLASARFGILMERCLRDFDLTIIDTPPANSCADARRISNLVGYSLIVAKRHESYVADIAALSSQLAEDRAKVIGTVMNEA